jgi:integral membrane protein
MLQTSFSRFKVVAFLEGCSFLLFAITMPLKYKFNMPGPNKIIGMAHGILFLLYIILLLQVAIAYKWNFKKIGLAFIASLLPFGTFIAAKKVYPTP